MVELLRRAWLAYVCAVATYCLVYLTCSDRSVFYLAFDNGMSLWSKAVAWSGFRAWQPRVGAPLITSALFNSAQGYQHITGMWWAIWMFLALIIHDARRVPILWACVTASQLMSWNRSCLPWDGPMFCLSSFAALCWERRQPVPLCAAIIAFLPIKETSVIYAAVTLLMPMRWKKRCIIASTLFPCMLMAKWMLNHLTETGVALVSPELHNGQGLILWQNVVTLLTPQWDHVSMAGCGLVALALVSRPSVALLAVFVALASGNMVYSMLQEYRHWNEVIPFAVLQLYGSLGRAERREKKNDQ